MEFGISVHCAQVVPCNGEIFEIWLTLLCDNIFSLVSKRDLNNSSLSSDTGQALNSRKITREKTFLAIKVNIPLENKVMHRAIS